MLNTLRHVVLSAMVVVSVAATSSPGQAARPVEAPDYAGLLLRPATTQPAPDPPPPQPTPNPKPPQPGAPVPITPIPGAKPLIPPPVDTGKVINVRFVTTAGDIVVELNNEKAPISVKNFLAYVDKKAYDNTIFHRVIADFVIQGGGFTKDLKEIKGEAPIKNEWQNGLRNLRGTIAMARDEEPDTAKRQFYFNTADNAKLDTPRETTGKAGYAVFGKVIAGMGVIDKIRMGKTHDVSNEMKNVPDEPVTVTTITRISDEDARKAAEAEPTTPPAPRPAPVTPPEKKDEKPQGEPPVTK
ncbi:MAG: peptidylprolyl isomerase [Pyrinomonadaceae bacterium]|nr:peptidylprolyl isomerase [Phycisphaerales bacterium]